MTSVRSGTDATAASRPRGPIVAGRPSVRYAFTADKKLVLSNWAKDKTTPVEVPLTDGIGAGTRTTHDDGTADYAFVYAGDLGGATATIKLHVDAAGLLANATATMTGYKETLAYTYGAQKITLPAAAVTVDAATLAKAKAYVTMPARVQKAANDGAAHTRKAAKGRTVKVASLRATVRKDAAAVNRSAGVVMVKVVDVAGGVRVSATNPWTHQTVAYTVKASGKKVLVKKA